ncbi:MAG: DUF2828 domain-containing protein [Clostridium sp.]|nr:DUF2828 domain-containing protein [Acetatifactor muris]MCM1527589.1 DUF2828 domain-containing protein [Bacteroides sp.]MCM1563830.1 DUF2828 domain-containing protein [Clostridium sp.]
MNRAIRFDNQDIQKEIAGYDITQSHAVHFARTYRNVSRTENGALGYRTTGHELLDLNFRVSSLRGREERYIADSFVKAFYEDRRHAVKWLFYLRDIAEGLGERRSFRVCLKYLAQSHPEIAGELMELIPLYGRYDDLLVLLDSPLEEKVCAYIGRMLERDLCAMAEGRPVSLLAKWLPGNDTSSKATRALAGRLSRGLGMGSRAYRKNLSALRAYADVLEVKISASEWDRVDYAKVPAKANLKYDAAFARHDEARRSDWLRSVYMGDDKINCKGLMPYEIVRKMLPGTGWCSAVRSNLLAELMWQKLLQDGFQNEWGLEDCIVVADGSGSMYSPVSGTAGVRAIDVCHSLAIYFASKLQGVFRDKAISFSRRPQMIDLGQGGNLREKLEIMRAHDEVDNTDIEAVFDLLLDMAVSRQVPAEQIPGQVLIISDMEFDEAAEDHVWENGRPQKTGETLFEFIAAKFSAAGYPVPRLIFWNVCGRSDTIPAVQGEQGVCLLSGFSQNAIRTAAHREIKDPYESLLRTLDGSRYAPVEEALSRAGVGA